ncbi:MAG: L-tyrosine/L-tryptophan isonitrile synthase family protein [Arenicella sp.]
MEDLASRYVKHGFLDLSVSKDILEKIFEYRVLIDEDPCEKNNLNVSDQYTPHINKINSAVELEKPIVMILPAFPGKSPNRKKTLGAMPDLAEREALAKLHELCTSIKSIYPPGAKVLICSDGYCFADIVHISDEDILDYSNIIKSEIRDKYSETVGFFDLTDAFDHTTNFDLLREELMVLYAESMSVLKDKCKHDKFANAMFKGITRFLLEDYSGLSLYGSFSRNAIQQQAKKNAARVIQRSNAWSRLLENLYPEAVRLSIHPQFSVSEKIGIRLVESHDNWLTPWHSVAIKLNEKVVLAKRSDVDEEKYALVFKKGHPSHFELSRSANQ